MYKIDYYKEKVVATEVITEGKYICTPFQLCDREMYIMPNERVGEFITEDANGYNCHLVKVPSIGRNTLYMLEATGMIVPGETLIMKPDPSVKLRSLQENVRVYNERYYGIPGKKLFRLRNTSDIIIANEALDSITDMKDKLTLIQSLKEASKRYGLNLGLDSDTGELLVYTEAAANTSNSKRKAIENHILTTMSKLDKSGTNTNFYRDAFKEMNDQQFDQWVKKLIEDPEENLYMEILPYKNEPTLKDIKEGLEYLKVPTNEYVYFRHDENGKEIRTRYPVSVGYIQVKRLQQILSKKNTYSTSIKSRNMKTGQVSGDDKIARISDSETYVMSAVGLDKALEEFLGPRADGSTKMAMYSQIATYGYCSLKDIEPYKDITQNQTVNTISTYLLGAGIDNDLLDESYKLKEDK